LTFNGLHGVISQKIALFKCNEDFSERRVKVEYIPNISETVTVSIVRGWQFPKRWKSAHFGTADCPRKLHLGMEWIQLAEDRVQWRAVGNKVMILGIL
jgi:hypothetical protein